MCFEVNAVPPELPAHLSAHLAMRTILTPEQIARYDEMRGYTATAPGSSPSTEALPSHQHMHR